MVRANAVKSPSERLRRSGFKNGRVGSPAQLAMVPRVRSPFQHQPALPSQVTLRTEDRLPDGGLTSSFPTVCLLSCCGPRGRRDVSGAGQRASARVTSLGRPARWLVTRCSNSLLWVSRNEHLSFWKLPRRAAGGGSGWHVAPFSSFSK